jgi:MFS family permease
MTTTTFEMPAASSDPAVASRTGHWLRALRHRNFRLFFFGQGVSLIGTWMQQTALAWLVLRLTNDPFLMGLNTFVGQIPSLLFMPLAGVLVDRWSRLPFVIVTQTLAMIQAFVLAGLVLFDMADIWHLMGLAFGLGCVNAFDMPARQALLPEMLDVREDLSNAIALNSSLFNAARLVGPALAGLLADLGPAGEGWCFFLNAVSFLAVLAALFSIKVHHSIPARSHAAPVLAGILEGVAFAWRLPALRGVLILVAVLGFVAMPYTVLVPIFAKEVLQGGASTYGTMLTVSGVGALIGALYLAGRASIRGSASRIAVAGVASSVALAAFASCNDFQWALAIIFVVGLCLMLMLVSCNIIVQTIVPDAMRGRIMSLYNLAFMGMTPFGGLLAGWIAKGWGPRPAGLCCAAGCLFGTLLFLPSLGAVRAAIRSHLAGRPIPGMDPLPETDPPAPMEELTHV